MPISERSFRVHSVFGKLRIGILLVSLPGEIKE